MARLGKRGRVQGITSPRAIVRSWPKPDDLLDACEKAGYEVHASKDLNRHTIVGPTGRVTIPRDWDRQRGRRQSIASDLRKAGINLNPPEEEQEPVTVLTNAEANALKDRIKAPENGSTLSIPQQAPAPLTRWVAREDFDALLAMVTALETRVNALSELVATPTTKTQDRLGAIRTRILDWFHQLPPGMRVPAAAVTGNLAPDADKSESSVYYRQVAKLVELGQLQVHGATGKTPQYSLAAPDGQGTLDVD